MLSFTCKLCAEGKHDECRAEQAKRDYSSCDCQHRVKKNV